MGESKRDLATPGAAVRSAPQLSDAPPSAETPHAGSSVNCFPRLVSLGTAVPPHVIAQEDARQLATRLFGARDGSWAEASEETLDETLDERLLAVFDHGGVRTRHTCVPLAWFENGHEFGETNDLYVEHAVRLAAEASTRALAHAHLVPEDIDHVVYVSSTGIATPTVDARLANVLGFRPDVRRTPIWGLGCSGGAAGVGRARELALAAPRSRVLVIALELCSLTFQRRDHSKRNLVATSLFADGAAAAVVLGPEVTLPANGRRALELVACGSTLWPDSLDVMGWQVDGDGLHLVLARDLPATVQRWIRPALDAFLRPHGFEARTLEHLVAHPGGAKVLRGLAEALELPEARFRHSWDVLRDYGNMSSPTCLFVLDRFLDAGEFAPGQHGVLAALGAGFSAEYVLLRGAGDEN